MTPDNLRTLFPTLVQASEDSLLLFLQRATRVEVPAGAHIISASEENDSLYLILKGCVRVSLESEEECTLLGELETGQWIGELGMIQPAVGVAIVVAVEDCVLLRLRHSEFMELRQSSPGLTSVLLQMLCNNLARRLGATIRFIDAEDDLPDANRSKATTSQWMTEVARNLIGVAARTGA